MHAPSLNLGREASVHCFAVGLGCQAHFMSQQLPMESNERDLVGSCFKADFVQDYIQSALRAKQRVNNYQFVKLKPC